IDHGRRTHRDFFPLDSDSAARGSAPGGRDMTADGGVPGRSQGNATAGGTHRSDRGCVSEIHFAAGDGNLAADLNRRAGSVDDTGSIDDSRVEIHSSSGNGDPASAAVGVAGGES